MHDIGCVPRRRTCLHWASFNGHLDIVDLLLLISLVRLNPLPACQLDQTVATRLNLMLCASGVRDDLVPACAERAAWGAHAQPCRRCIAQPACAN